MRPSRPRHWALTAGVNTGAALALLRFIPRWGAAIRELPSVVEYVPGCATHNTTRRCQLAAAQASLTTAPVRWPCAARRSWGWWRQLARCVGRHLSRAGLMVMGQRIRTSSGRLMTFASLCDRSGVMELTCFEDAAERYGELLHLGRVLRVRERVTHDVERGVGVEVQAVAELLLRGEVAASVDGSDTPGSSEVW